MEYRIRWENKNLDDMGTLRLLIHDVIKVNNCLVVYNRVNLLRSNAVFCLPGVPCQILSMENGTIKCQTREAPPADKYDFYSGKHDSSEHGSLNLLPVHDVINTQTRDCKTSDTSIK